MNPISNKEIEQYNCLLFNKTQAINDSNYLSCSEYKDNFNGNRLYNIGTTEQYVSKKIHDESDFWKGGKFAYDDKDLKDNLIYMTTKRQDHKEHIIPEEFLSKQYNMRKTFISEYANLSKH
jgi:hypothetical protein